MIIYVCIASFLFLGYLVPKKFQDIYYNTSLALLFVFTAFRNIDLGGYDAENYQSFFTYRVPILENFLSYNSEYAYGYGLFNSVVKTFTTDYRYFQVFYTVLSIFLLRLVIKKLDLKKNERHLFLFVYFCYRYLWNSFVLLRQNIAVLLLWIVLFTVFDKTFKYYFNIVITWLWHKSSLINMLVYPVIKQIMKIKKNKMLIITIISSIILLIFSQPVFNYLLSIVSRFTDMKYYRYFLDENGFESMNYINYLIKWVFVLLFYFNYDKIKNPHKEIILNLSFFVLIMSSINTAIVSRMVEYYMVSIYVIVVLINQVFKDKSKFLYIMGVYSLFIAILIRFLYTFNGGELLEYTTFWG